MRSHKAVLTVPADRMLRLQLPKEFPPGAVEVIVRSAAPPQERATKPAEDAFAARFPRIADLADGMVLHEDPALPLDEADWGKLAG